MTVDVGLLADPPGPPARSGPPPRPEGGERRSPPAGRGPSPLWRRLLQNRRRAKSADVVLMVRHLATLLGAGLPLFNSLRTVARQLKGSPLGSVVEEVADDVEAGEMLSSAMAARTRIFDSLTVNVVRAGEAGGTLPETLDQLADDMEDKHKLRRTVLGAMVYPAIVIAIAAVVVGFVLVYVVPVFEGVYAKMRLELPLVTQVLLLVSRGTVRYWWALLLGVGSLALAWRYLKELEAFRRHWDRLMLQLPVFGKLRRMAIASRFLGAFATLTSSGVTIVESLRLMVHLADNLVVQEAIESIHHHVCRGGRMSEPMERYADLFSPMAIQMVSVGEQTGSLPEAAARTANFLAAECEARVKTLTTLIEPMLTVGLGVVVGTIALAIYLPMFDLMTHVSQ